MKGVGRELGARMELGATSQRSGIGEGNQEMKDNLVVDPPNIAWKTIGSFQIEHNVL